MEKIARMKDGSLVKWYRDGKEIEGIREWRKIEMERVRDRTEIAWIKGRHSFLLSPSYRSYYHQRKAKDGTMMMITSVEYQEERGN